MARRTVFILLALLLGLPTLAGIISGGRAGLSYATSGSMEPSLMTGDGFVVVPSWQITAGDIIVYRPVRLEAHRIVHRVVALTEEGMITRGEPVRIPRLGALSARLAAAPGVCGGESAIFMPGCRPWRS